MKTLKIKPVEIDSVKGYGIITLSTRILKSTLAKTFKLVKQLFHHKLDKIFNKNILKVKSCYIHEIYVQYYQQPDVGIGSAESKTTEL